MIVKRLKNSSGIAVIEILPLLVIFVAFIGITLGLWGAIHAGTLQSIAAKHYAMEVINNRVHIIHHRDYPFSTSSSGKMNMLNNQKETHRSQCYPVNDFGSRFFGIVAHQPAGSPSSLVASRGINVFKERNRGDSEDIPGAVFGRIKETDKTSFHQDLPTANIKDLPRSRKRVNPIWLMQGYGICMNNNCGDKKTKN